MKVLVTGSAGFVGTHVVEALRRRPDTDVVEYHRGCTSNELESALTACEYIFHLAGANRPLNPAEFEKGNAGFTDEICETLARLGRKPVIVFSSSIQACQDNLYGKSKLQAENILRNWANRAGGSVVCFRIRNVFGKWSRPNYNSVTATFCYNIAHDLPITISDPLRELELVYIDDVVAELVSVLGNAPETAGYTQKEIPGFTKITLGELAGKIRSFRESRSSLRLPTFDDQFTRQLYATYLSYLDKGAFSYPLDKKTDPRGSLAEFMKAPGFGQIFVSRTKPGITRGNHYHHTKAEKFLVVEGEAIIRFRSIHASEVIEYPVSGKDFKVLDIPPGYTHSIENVGNQEMVTVFWASEIFDSARPDTVFQSVMS
jgi:UDP-2-acetamido-2,6-beta-L-arabino-hexul-4-ose reductase